jgi:hypothetical protein
MAADASKSLDLSIAFVLDELSLRRIVSILEGVSKPIEFEIACSDQFSVTYSTLDDVLNFPNSSQRRITALSLTTPWGKSPGISVSLRNRDFLSMQSRVRGTEQEVYLIAPRLEEALAPLRPWYSVISKWDLSIVFPGLLAVSVILGYLGFRIAVTHHSHDSVGVGILTGFVSWGILFLPAVFSAPLVRMVFPMGSFLIGDGVRRHQATLFWRRIVGGGLFISVLGSIIASLILR